MTKTAKNEPKLSLYNFINLDKAKLLEILSWRNNPRIAKACKKSFVDEAEHFAFVKALEKDKSRLYFLACEKELGVGVINFIHLCKESAEFGLYQNPNLHGYGHVLMQTMLQYAFNELKLQKLYACVKKDNERAINLYFDFKFALDKQDDEFFYLCLLSDVGGGG